MRKHVPGLGLLTAVAMLALTAPAGAQVPPGGTAPAPAETVPAPADAAAAAPATTPVDPATLPRCTSKVTDHCIQKQAAARPAKHKRKTSRTMTTTETTAGAPPQ
jgi:hypothetical protein